MLHQASAPPVMLEEKCCYRCGALFETLNGRVCPACKRPRHGGRKAAAGQVLTSREQQITALVAAARSNREIAGELHLTVGTIKEYLNRIFTKMGFHNRTELALWWGKRPGA